MNVTGRESMEHLILLREVEREEKGREGGRRGEEWLCLNRAASCLMPALCVSQKQITYNVSDLHSKYVGGLLST